MTQLSPMDVSHAGRTNTDTDIILALRRKYRSAIDDFCLVVDRVVDPFDISPEVETIIGRYFRRDPDSGDLVPKD